MLLQTSSLPEPPLPVVLDASSGASLFERLAGSSRSNGDPFTAHVFTCLFSIAFVEMMDEGITMDAALGLDRDTLVRLVEHWAPHPLLIAAAHGASGSCALDEEEEQVRKLLQSHAVDAGPDSSALCAMIARRAMRPNHLWQDLGLHERGELNRLLRERVPTLHARNTADMKWKKFFYRSLCELEGFTLCTAPSCRECCDFDRCFGAEDGESRIAQIRRATETLSHI